MVRSLRELILAGDILMDLGMKEVKASELDTINFSIYNKSRLFEAELVKISPSKADAYRKQEIGRNGNFTVYKIWFYKINEEQKDKKI